MAEFAGRLKVMQKEDYNSKKTELVYDAEYRAENGTHADDLQILMQRAELRADVFAEYGSDAEMSCRNGLQKPCSIWHS